MEPASPWSVFAPEIDADLCRTVGTDPVAELPWYSELEFALGGGGGNQGTAPKVKQQKQFLDIGEEIGKPFPPPSGGLGCIASPSHPAQSHSFGMIDESKEN